MGAISAMALLACCLLLLYLTVITVVVSSCSNGKGDPSQHSFGVSLLKALLDNMPYLPAAATGGK